MVNLGYFECLKWSSFNSLMKMLISGNYFVYQGEVNFPFLQLNLRVAYDKKNDRYSATNGILYKIPATFVLKRIILAGFCGIGQIC